jgi:TonB family protein
MPEPGLRTNNDTSARKMAATGVPFDVVKVAHTDKSVSAPVLLYGGVVDLSDGAAKPKYKGVAVVGLTVDAKGNPQNPKVMRPLGMGLDEKAMEAVRAYKFKPAMKDGTTPVAEAINVEVQFTL